MRFVLCLLIHLVLAAAVLGQTKPIVLRTDVVGVRATPGERVNTKLARAVLKDTRASLKEVSESLGLGPKDIFHLRSRRPLWATWTVNPHPRIWVHLSDSARLGDMGAEAFLDRMSSGTLRIHVRAPRPKPTPDDRHRLTREMTYAVLSQSLWRTCPIWLREGIADHLGDRAAGGESSMGKLLRDQLKSEVGSLPIREILAATDREDWGRRGGRAISFGLVRLMDESSDRALSALLSRIGSLATHLATHPGEDRVLAEFTRIVRAEVESSGSGEGTLRVALSAWVEAGFPTGGAFRKCGATLPKLDAPSRYGLLIDGRFGMRTHQPDENDIMHTLQPFTAGVVVWRFPWESRIETWIGVRGRPGTNLALRPEAARDGYFVEGISWRAGPEGRKALAPKTLDLTRRTTKIGFVWVGVTSPGGLGYLYRREWKLK